MEPGLKNTTVVLMIVVALFFDALQALLTPLFMGWAVGIFAGLTFFVWFKIHGISFMKPKRFMAFAGSTLVEIIPFLSAIPAWTFAVSYLAITAKLKEKIPLAGKVLDSKGPSTAQSTEKDSSKAA